MNANSRPPTGRIVPTPQGRALIIERTFRASIDDVWASLTEPDRVARWYGTVEGDQTPGSTLMLTMTNEDGAPTEPALVIECDPPHRFVIETPGPGAPWRLDVALKEADGVTTMTFNQALTDDIDASDVGPGWEYYADRHQAAFEGTEMPDWEADRYQERLGRHYADS